MGKDYIIWQSHDDKQIAVFLKRKMQNITLWHTSVSPYKYKVKKKMVLNQPLGVGENFRFQLNKNYLHNGYMLSNLPKVFTQISQSKCLGNSSGKWGLSFLFHR